MTVDFEYLAGVEYKEGRPLPEETVIREVPECTVAIFKHVGGADTLYQTYNNIYNTWLPASAYQRWNLASTWRFIPKSLLFSLLIR